MSLQAVPIDDSEERQAQAQEYGRTLAWMMDRLGGVVGHKKGLAKHQRQKLMAACAARPTREGLMHALMMLFQQMELELSGWIKAPSEKELPMVVFDPTGRLALVYGISADGRWQVEDVDGRRQVESWEAGTLFTAVRERTKPPASQTARALFVGAFRERPGWIYQAALASCMASMLLLGTSLYSMQVYDRVIGSGAVSTLIVLTVGVSMAIIVELFIKMARSVIVNKAISDIDRECAHGVFKRLMELRLDQYPASVGSLAAQVRSFETIRGFSMALVLFLTTDAPFAIFFLFIILVLGGPLVAAVPLCFMLLSIGVGLTFKHRIEHSAQAETVVGNQRQGVLIESIEGAESLKAAGAGWKMLARWNRLTDQGDVESQRIRRLNETSSFISATLQQISYVGLVAAGAWIAATSTSLTMGGIIASSILSGRVLAPVAMIPGLLVQWAHAKEALGALEKLFALERDNHNMLVPLLPDVVKGRLELSDVQFVYPGQVTAVTVQRLQIQPGEKVAIIGSVGAGKSTLLRLLGGLIKPQRGKVMIDGLDIQQIEATRRAELIGILPQFPSLFSGTLRDNLTSGLPFMADENILAVCEMSGLKQMIASRSDGLDMQMGEGGSGLSGGQRQLVVFTRLLLAQPRMWLLDEPTASMDEASEARCLAALLASVRAEQTLVLVTHKPRLLSLVSRIVVLTPDGVAMDGPRDEVLAKLSAAAGAAKRVQTKPAIAAVTPPQGVRA